MYKDDKLAEICEQFEAKNFQLTEQIVELKHRCGELNIWDDTMRLFEKLEKLPANDFIRLYYMMDKIMKDKPVITTTITNPSYDDYPSSISQRIYNVWNCDFFGEYK